MAQGAQRASRLFLILLGNKAKKQFKSLQTDYRERVKEVFRKLESEPVPYKDYDLRKLEGRSETYRLRLSSFRVVYQVLWNEKTILVGRIERKSETTYD